MKRVLYGIGLVLLVLAINVSLTLAQGGFGLTGGTVDSGGGSLQTADGSFGLNGSIGQPDVGALSDASGTFTLSGGLWESTNVSSGPGSGNVYLPIILRN
jgi:hypothetical protein